MTDTLAIDSVLTGRWRAQQDFDYTRELADGGTSFADWLKSLLSEWLNDMFGTAWENDYAQWALAAVGVVVVGFIVWYAWRYHRGLFRGQESGQQASEATEDTIYGIDFDVAINEAAGRADYREAVRLVYLRTLKVLSDRGQIDWQPWKTPSQYVGELTAPGDVASFRSLTSHFLRVRYGNFPATRALYDEVAALGKEVSHEP